MRIFGLLLALALASCGMGPQELVDTCLRDGVNCPPCTSNADCVIASNLCHETASCVHRELNYGVTQEGCSLEHDPPEERCSCIESVCRSEATFCALPEGCD